MRLAELVILFIAILAPWFVMATKISSDEGRKLAASAGIGAVMAGYLTWKKKSSSNTDQKNDN